MDKAIALLRGVNVGGNNMIPMPRLKEAFRKAGYSDAETYINSGNVIFSSGEEAAAPSRLPRAHRRCLWTGYRRRHRPRPGACRGHCPGPRVVGNPERGKAQRDLRDPARRAGGGLRIRGRDQAGIRANRGMRQRHFLDGSAPNLFKDAVVQGRRDAGLSAHHDPQRKHGEKIGRTGDHGMRRKARPGSERGAA